MGLGILGSLPLPWQQRCSALHEHPHLILETLLMWKELHVASQVLFFDNLLHIEVSLLLFHFLMIMLLLLLMPQNN